MKGRIETGDLWQVGLKIPQCSDAQQTGRLVVRRQRDQGLQIGEGIIGSANRCVQTATTVHDTMTHRSQLQRGLLFCKPLQQDLQGLGMIGNRYVPGKHRGVSGFRDAKLSRAADGGKITPVQALWFIRVMDGKQRKLEAG